MQAVHPVARQIDPEPEALKHHLRHACADLVVLHYQQAAVLARPLRLRRRRGRRGHLLAARGRGEQLPQAVALRGLGQEGLPHVALGSGAVWVCERAREHEAQGGGRGERREYGRGEQPAVHDRYVKA